VLIEAALQIEAAEPTLKSATKYIQEHSPRCHRQEKKSWLTQKLQPSKGRELEQKCSPSSQSLHPAACSHLLSFMTTVPPAIKTSQGGEAPRTGSLMIGNNGVPLLGTNTVTRRQHKKTTAQSCLDFRSALTPYSADGPLHSVMYEVIFISRVFQLHR